MSAGVSSLPRLSYLRPPLPKKTPTQPVATRIAETTPHPLPPATLSCRSSPTSSQPPPVFWYHLSRLNLLFHRAPRAISTRHHIVVRAVLPDARILSSRAMQNCRHVLCFRNVTAVRQYHQKTHPGLSAFL